MLKANQHDYAREQAAAKRAADKKAAEIRAEALAIEKARVRAAVALAQAVEWESRIEGILTLDEQVTALENRVRSSAEILDAKIVDFDSPIHWVKRNWLTVASIILGNAVVSALLFRLLR
jgi:hypothetical protein